MPKRTDIKKILIIGAGPIVIGQACEFDYSGTQATKALKELGYFVILVNSNAATIMNDSTLADRTYIEPLTYEFLEKIIEKERPDALLPTVGGQTALNLGMELAESGVLEKFGVQMIGADLKAIKKAEDREQFRDAMQNIGLKTPKNQVIYSKEEAEKIICEIGLPCVIRASFALGGSGSGIAYNKEEFDQMISDALAASGVGGVEILQSIIGFKEYELEIVTDQNENTIIICSIENIDPMGVHTGDSITVAPALTLTDKEYQLMRNSAKMILKEIGIQTGGANVQFAVNPKTGEQFVIEMNPRVSRSSALASKATGYPIAKIAACVAVGLTLDEIDEGMGGGLPASFEPSIDYIVVKIPKFNFEKFIKINNDENFEQSSLVKNQLLKSELSTSMKAIGEVMSQGGNFLESLQKAFISLEEGLDGVYSKIYKTNDFESLKAKKDEIAELISKPIAGRFALIADFLRASGSEEGAVSVTKFDPWFIMQLGLLVKFEKQILEMKNQEISKEFLFELKNKGFSDSRISYLLGRQESEISLMRDKMNLLPIYKKVDSCASEFDVEASHLYSQYSSSLLRSGEGEEPAFCELKSFSKSLSEKKKKVIILGSGPNRIGQGIEFDYSCVHASKAVCELGFESIMINCNPETVSTDYETSDKLYFEPLSQEHILNIIKKEEELSLEKKEGDIEFLGIISQFAGQTGLKLAKSMGHLKEFKLLGTGADSLDLAEDRQRFRDLLNELGLLQPNSLICDDLSKLSHMCAKEIGFPVILRPSYVLGGRAMSIIYDENQLENYIAENKDVLENGVILIDEFLVDASEVDVDALCDGQETYIAGIMEHIEEAGIHSGDSNCVIPPVNLEKKIIEEIKMITRKLAKALKVIGLLNIQFAIKEGKIYIIEANPRASRTIPFISKFKNIPFASLATKIICGALKISDLRSSLPDEDHDFKRFAVKTPVFPFLKFKDADWILGPEMKSTGESMGIDLSFEGAFAKAFIAANGRGLPKEGNVIISVKDFDKNETLIETTKILLSNGFKIFATKGTYEFLSKSGLSEIQKIPKLRQSRPNLLDMILNLDCVLYINTSDTSKAFLDGVKIRRAAMTHKIPCIRNLFGANALAKGIDFASKNQFEVFALQDF
jgi:carbamoyl-phosphate synthase large subunit